MNFFQRLAHRLFGWHYVGFRIGGGPGCLHVTRLRHTISGVAYFKFCGEVREVERYRSALVPLTFAEEAKPDEVAGA